MVRPLDEPVPDFPLPSGLEVRPALPEQYRQIIEASDEAFQDHWGHVPLTENMIQEWMDGPEFQPELWQVAWDGEQVAGMVLNYIRHDENERFDRKRGYTEDISVRRPWRRRGLATALLARSLNLLKERGMVEAALGVDTENPSGALQLYERLGFERLRTMTNYRKLVR
jgi:ribosomal protein S18 acetylase RimI-like enzyme